MQKIKAKKEVIEQITSKLKLSENNELSTKKVDSNIKNAQKQANSDLLEGINTESSKLQANKNIFARGDFDDYKISDEELMDCQEDIDKSYTKREFVSGNGKRQSYWRTRTYEGIEGKTNNFNKNKQTKTNVITELKSHISNLRNKQSLAEKKEILEKYTECTDVVRINNVDIMVHPSRNPQNLNKQERKKVIRELTTISKLCKHGFDVALTKEVSGNKNFDFIINGVLYELKNTNGTNLNSIEHRYSEALEQSSNVIMCFDSKNTMLSHFREFHLMKKAGNTEKKHTSIIIMYKDSDDIYFYDFGQKKGSTEVPPTNLSITKNKNMSSKISKSLTYSGHKLQGRTKLYGMDISIENKKGSYRSGVDSDGHKWRTYMNYDYGYIRGTVGVDSDHIDVYLGPDKEAEKVYVIHQNNPVTHKYDEDKCMLCFESADAAKKAYMKQYDRPGFFGSMDVLSVEQFKSYVFSSLNKGKRIHKSFDIQVTDITENNKGQKIQQVEKALDSLYQGKNFAIQHIGLDDSVRYGNVTLRIKDFDKESINKAVRSLSFTLDEPLKAAKGEAFQYKAQEELTNLIVKELTDATKSVYQFVIDYFDLPEMRIVQKSKLRWKGKVLYNPETGKPIEKSEWKRFTQKLEEFLNRTYSGIGQKIVLSSEALGRILNRLSKTNTIEAIRKMKLSDLIYKHRTFDWISNTAKNMKDVFGESLTRDRQARVQAAIDSAAQRITKISDDMRNEVQQIIIDGVKDRKSKSQVSQALFDKMVGENRDFQRVADTEIQDNTTSAYIHEEVYHTNDGEKVYFKRFEKVDDNTCKKCKELKGKIVLYSEKPLESENIKDEYTDKAIWEGKTTGIPFSTCHPYCRGTWGRYYPDAD